MRFFTVLFHVIGFPWIDMICTLQKILISRNSPAAKPLSVDMKISFRKQQQEKSFASVIKAS